MTVQKGKTITAEALERVVFVFQELIKRGQLREDAFDAAESNARRDFGAARESDAEYEQIMTQLRTAFSQR